MASYYFAIDGFYAFGWEEITAEDSRKLARQTAKLYRENEPGTTFRIVRRRDLS